MHIDVYICVYIYLHVYIHVCTNTFGCVYLVTVLCMYTLGIMANVDKLYTIKLKCFSTDKEKNL